MTTTMIDEAEKAVASYASDHREEPVALPELVDAVAEAAGTGTEAAKRAVFVYFDKGIARFTPDFMVVFGAP